MVCTSVLISVNLTMVLKIWHKSNIVLVLWRTCHPCWMYPFSKQCSLCSLLQVLPQHCSVIAVLCIACASVAHLLDGYLPCTHRTYHHTQTRERALPPFRIAGPPFLRACVPAVHLLSAKLFDTSQLPHEPRLHCCQSTNCSLPTCRSLTQHSSIS